MKKYRIFAFVLVGVVAFIAFGIRTSIGQGYSDPVVRPVGVNVETTSKRTLRVELKNRETGRPQNYQWSLSVPPNGSVEVECHEWMFVRFFGLQVFGAPRNSFRRTIPLDVPADGVAEPYDFAIRWEERRPNQ